jgi:hypothetical protein
VGFRISTLVEKRPNLDVIGQDGGRRKEQGHQKRSENLSHGVSMPKHPQNSKHGAKGDHHLHFLQYLDAFALGIDLFPLEYPDKDKLVCRHE